MSTQNNTNIRTNEQYVSVLTMLHVSVDGDFSVIHIRLLVEEGEYTGQRGRYVSGQRGRHVFVRGYRLFVQPIFLCNTEQRRSDKA